jgi:uncharacterized membrane protein YbhN (UPF0104 family)
MVVPGSIPSIIRSFANLIALFCRMSAHIRKAKQYLIALAKLLVVGGAFYFIYDRLANNEQLDWAQLTTALKREGAYYLVLLILVCTFLNRFLEIVKWRNLISYIKPISLAMATEQVLAAVTAAIFTPNGIGEYAAKALYYEKKDAKNIVFLNLICNGVQLIIAVAGGIIGLVIFNTLYPVLPLHLLWIAIGVVTAFVLILISLKKVAVKGYSLQKLVDRINVLPKSIHKKNTLLALLRYLAIIHQHYFLFLAFDVHLPYPVMISAIAGIYFLGSSLPTFQFLDFAVKGSVAVYFLGILGINEWIVVFAATLQWLLNIVIPVTIGSYFILRFKSTRTAIAPH